MRQATRLAPRLLQVLQRHIELRRRSLILHPAELAVPLRHVEAMHQQYCSEPARRLRTRRSAKPQDVLSSHASSSAGSWMQGFEAAQENPDGGCGPTGSINRALMAARQRAPGGQLAYHVIVAPLRRHQARH
jgi:hypothetical protein